MEIVITGGAGFLGSALAAHWRARGHTVRRTGRLRLGQPAGPRVFAGADLLVHAAHSFEPGSMNINIEGTRAWFHEARAAGVGHQVLIGSLSAHAGAASEYGAVKFALERFFVDNGGLVVRPGLVAGNGGLFARLVRPLLRWHAALLVKPGLRNVAVAGFDDFAAALTVLAVERSERGSVPLFAPGLLTAGEFARAAWRGAGQRGVVCPVAPTLAMAVLRLAGARRLLDSLRGQLTAPALPASDLPRLVPQLETAESAVARAAAEMCR